MSVAAGDTSDIRPSLTPGHYLHSLFYYYYYTLKLYDLKQCIRSFSRFLIMRW